MISPDGVFTVLVSRACSAICSLSDCRHRGCQFDPGEAQYFQQD